MTTQRTNLPMNSTQTMKRRGRFRPKRPTRQEIFITGGLILLSLVPAAGSVFRLGTLVVGTEVTPENLRFFTAPIPILLHVISVLLYSLLGAFQFAPTFRRIIPRWHRWSGRLLVPSGFIVALSGLWMSQFYILPPQDGILLYWLRLVFGIGMLIAMTMGTLAIRQRNFRQHGNWMIRAYAIAMGAGTQVLTGMPLFLFSDLAMDPTVRGIAMGAGWIINLLVAEWVIRRSAA